MPYEEINESIEMIALFTSGRIEPLRFRWQDKVFKINTVNSSWAVQVGSGKEYHFSVTISTKDCFELIFESSGMNWLLARIYLEG